MNPSPMEDPRANLPPQQQKTKKRQLDLVHLQSTPYFKMRAIVKELRPHIIEVLRTPDFRNCKAATEIRQELNVLMDLCKEMAAESTPAPNKSKNTVEGLKPPSIAPQNTKTSEKPPPPPPPPTTTKPPEDKVVPPRNPAQWHYAEANAKGTYRVGGSAFGWNFIYYPGGTAVYYGRTKESFRSANPKSQ